MKKLWIIFIVLLIVVVGILFYLKDSASQINNWVKAENDFTSTTLFFLNVGQGDATFIDFENKTQMLVDCGRDAKVLTELGKVLSYKDYKIDYLLITHSDLDHYGGCIDVLDRFDVGRVVYNGQQKTSEETWNIFWKKVQDEGSAIHTIKSEEKWYLGKDSLYFLYPDGSLIPNLSDNNHSIVFMLESGGVKTLFTGDAEDAEEMYLIAKYGEKLDADILKVGHHGSQSSSGEEFVEKVTPEFSIIPVGKNNYGHPSLRVVRRLQRLGSLVFRTDLLQGIKIVLDGDLDVENMR
jgi:competence protein ComEC